VFAECRLAHDILVLKGTQLADPVIVQVTVKECIPTTVVLVLNVSIYPKTLTQLNPIIIT
jgi:hypothetical protein